MNASATYFKNCSEFRMRATYCTARFMYGYEGDFETFNDAMKHAKEPINPENVKHISAKESAEKLSMGTSESLVRLAERGAELGLWDGIFYEKRMEQIKQRSKKYNHLSVEQISVNQNRDLSQALIESRRQAVVDIYDEKLF